MHARSRYLPMAMNVLAKIILFSALFVFACGDGDPDAPDDFDGCTIPRPCDVRQAACQQHALEVAACLRGSVLPAPVETVVLDQKSYLDAYVGDVDPAADPLSSSESAFRRALNLFGVSHLPADRRSDWTAQSNGTVGFYQSKTKRIVLRSEQVESEDRAEVFLVLVHEMTHALQDAEGALATRAEVDSLDAWLARRAMTEGEAVLTETRASIRMRGFEDTTADWMSWFQRWQDRVREQTAQSEDMFRERAHLFPYLYGANFLYRALQGGGVRAVRTVLGEASPRSTREVMGGFSDGRRLQPSQISRFAGSSAQDFTSMGRKVPIASLPAPWELDSVSHLGAWFVSETLRRLGYQVDPALIRGDSLSVLQTSAGPAPELAVFWRIELEPAALRESVGLGFQTIQLPTGRLLSQTRDANAVIFAAYSGDPRHASPPTWVMQAQDDLFFTRTPSAAPQAHP